MHVYRFSKITFSVLILSLFSVACLRAGPPLSQSVLEPTKMPDTIISADEPTVPADISEPTVPIAYPEPSGPHIIGVHDFEFVDTIYPVARAADAKGRRLMVRVWYPADHAQGERRRYFEDGELDALGIPTIEAISMFVANTSLLQPLGDILTYSYEDAPVSTVPGALPTVIFSHGGLSYVSQNTALMEELASHGYLVFSLTHPGGSSGILYPNGDAIQYDADYHMAVLGAISADESAGLNSREIAKRYDARAKYLVHDGGLGPWLPRWRDDHIALADFIETGGAGGLLGDIVQKADLSRLAYAGMSYGAAAAASAAQADQRAKVVVNLDGTHQSSDLLGTNIRVPLLAFTSEPVAYVPYTNEFFYEPLVAMGEREDIVRVWIPGITHLELSDNMFFPPSYRKAFPGGRTNGRHARP